MKRRNFLKGLLAVPASAAIPSLASGAGCVTRPVSPGGCAAGSSLARCAFFDYDGNLVMEGKFEPTLRMVIPVRHKVRFSDTHLTPAFDDAIFERVGNPRARLIQYEQTSGPRMPRRGYVI